MTSRTASGTKLLDGLKKHHCKAGVSLPLAAECSDSMSDGRSALKEVSSLSFPGHGREGGC
jgi:hypothetical protein